MRYALLLLLAACGADPGGLTASDGVHYDLCDHEMPGECYAGTWVQHNNGCACHRTLDECAIACGCYSVASWTPFTCTCQP